MLIEWFYRPIGGRMFNYPRRFLKWCKGYRLLIAGKASREIDDFEVAHKLSHRKVNPLDEYGGLDNVTIIHRNRFFADYKKHTIEVYGHIKDKNKSIRSDPGLSSTRLSDRFGGYRFDDY